MRHDGTVKRPALLLLLFLAGSASAEAKSDPAGTYRLVGQQDVASAIRIRKDGGFEYFLAAGALDERAQGRWRTDGGNLVLTTEPKPRAPAFERTSSARVGTDALSIKVIWSGGRGIPGVDIRIDFDGGPAVEGYTQEDGWTLPVEEKRTPRWIELAVPTHGLRSPRYPIDPKAGNALTFTLIPNDIGVVDFEGVRVERSGKALIVHRDGIRLRYEADGK